MIQIYKSTKNIRKLWRNNQILIWLRAHDTDIGRAYFKANKQMAQWYAQCESSVSITKLQAYIPKLKKRYAKLKSMSNTEHFKLHNDCIA